ncbi:transcriptional regulator [Marinobacterium mangrovicola]|uniref:Transcriptional regulator n=1 Tax=Marinobacterium mangrovicola TaxID=1476959 RepID=A0A4R1GBH6_9GAMM|nr:transcriptional regulator [Marinobacterium mangrovicola]
MPLWDDLSVLNIENIGTYNPLIQDYCLKTISFDLDALRTFVLGIELGSFALAAERLHRSTSAASAQLKKLEQQCDVALVRKVGRHLQPTDAGEVLLAYARRLLALNDEAAQAIGGAQLPGRIRFGMQEDFSEALLPSVLASFTRAHPQVQLSANVARNAVLLDGIRSDELDLALCWAAGESSAYSEVLAQLPLRWVGPAETELQRSLLTGEPLKLVMFEKPCLMRQWATEALDRAGIPWQVVFASQGLGGVWQAVQAGLGVTVRTDFGLPSSLSVISDGSLPPLGEIGIRLDRSRAELGEVEQRLYGILREQIQRYLGTTALGTTAETGSI